MSTELGDFTAWTEKHPTRIAGNRADVETVLRLLDEFLGVEPSELQVGDLDELLMEVYPRKVTVFDREDATGVIPSVRDVLAFLGDTERIEPAMLKRLTRELDAIEPHFLDTLMDPANWGPARMIMHAMTEEGVDPTDEEAVSSWIAQYNATLPGPDELTDDSVDLAEALGLPDHLPAIRLPPETDLAAAARASVLLSRVRDLAVWVGDRRQLIDDGLRTADAVAAARALGIAAPAAVDTMDDLPELVRLWELAVAMDLVTVTDGFATADLGYWPSGDDDDDLYTWATGFGVTLSSLALDADLAHQDQLDFGGAGAAALMLFLARSEGVPHTDLTGLIQEAATAGLPPVVAPKVWDAWVRAHGDPVDTLLARLAELGAVEIDDDSARFTPLGMWAMRDQLIKSGVSIPLLPPIDEMTAADLVAASDGMDEDELAAETESWLALRTPEAAVDELLDVAATARPAERIFATSVVTGLGTVAELRWRKALEQLELRPYAKLALNQLAGAEPPQNFAPGLEPSAEDLAWLLTDVLAASSEAFGGDELDQQFRAAVPQGQEQEIFDVMWRIPHPSAHDVLTMIGAHHPDKKIAKVARKAAFKAASR